MIITTEIEPLEVRIPRGAGWAVALPVLLQDGSNAPLDGVVATLELPEGVVWVAETRDSSFVWDRTEADVDSLTWSSGPARLIVTGGEDSVVWAIGRATVI